MSAPDADQPTDADQHWMRRALELAARGWGRTAPNPMVGAVVVGNGRVLGEAWHRRPGEPHAEPQALANAAAAAGAASGWTLYVNLEPCAHHGRTPPCTDAILAAPVTRVVVALGDPDPRVAGRGIAALRAAGLHVDVGVLATNAAELNHAFLGRLLRRRPFVALKVALSADGCIAAPDGRTAAITGGAARRHAHRLRAGYDGIMVGIETLRLDRPRLDTRLYDGPGGVPRRIVLDPSFRLEAEWLRDGEEPPLVVGAAAELDRLAPARRRELQAIAELCPVAGTRAALDWPALLSGLENNGLYSVLVEGGGNTHQRFLAADIWDRFYVYRNPKLQLGGRGWEAAAAWKKAAGAGRLLHTETLEDDRLEVWTHRGAWPAGS